MTILFPKKKEEINFSFRLLFENLIRRRHDSLKANIASEPHPGDNENLSSPLAYFVLIQLIGNFKRTNRKTKAQSILIG